MLFSNGIFNNLGSIAAALTALWISYKFYRIYRKSSLNKRRFDDKLFGTMADPERGIKAEPGIFDVIASLVTQTNEAQQNYVKLDKKFASVAFKIEKFENQLNNMATEVQDVKHNTQQLKPNGGHSLADKINNINNQMETHLTQFHQISDLSQCPSEGDK